MGSRVWGSIGPSPTAPIQGLDRGGNSWRGSHKNWTPASIWKQFIPPFNRKFAAAQRTTQKEAERYAQRRDDSEAGKGDGRLTDPTQSRNLSPSLAQLTAHTRQRGLEALSRSAPRHASSRSAVCEWLPRSDPDGSGGNFASEAGPAEGNQALTMRIKPGIRKRGEGSSS